MKYLKYAERAFDESADLHPDDADWKKATSWGYAAVAAHKRGGSYSNYVRYAKQHFKDSNYFVKKKQDAKSAIDIAGNASMRLFCGLFAITVPKVFLEKESREAVMKDLFGSHFSDEDDQSLDTALNDLRKRLKSAEAHHLDLKEGIKKFD
jgi:hypothetical protein